ncbi:helix-turn-helix domain-containing protein [Pseudalkalibacillus sp. JSM 102089]|uniref:helix-turn-helix domain-containing protein n=1 Tax=Pseudalkalibacillus sp. JSM 102089 TaxID=3229856 RepID=UPI003526A7F3
MMKLSYKPLEITLIKNDKTKTDLRNEVKLSPTIIAKIAKGETISLSSIMKICEYLDCDVEDVVEFVKVEQDA